MDDYPIQSPGQLASHLRALRQVRGLSQAQLGALLGVDQSRVARIERDPTAVSVAQFLSVLNSLGVQMVLHPTGESAGDAATAKRRPTDNPW